MKSAPLVQITLQRGAHSLVRYRGVEARGVQSRVSVVLLLEALQRVSWPRGIYLFTTLDGMTAAQLAFARRLWDGLSAHAVCMNEPGSVIGRYQ